MLSIQVFWNCVTHSSFLINSFITVYSAGVSCSFEILPLIFLCEQEGPKVWSGERSSWKQWIGLHLNNCWQNWVRTSNGQDARWEWGNIHLGAEGGLEQASPGDNHGRNRLPSVVSVFHNTQNHSFNPCHLWNINQGTTSLVFCGKSTNGQKTRECSFVFLILFWLDLSINPQHPQICSQVTLDTPGHCSHPPRTIWDSSCDRYLSPEVHWNHHHDTQAPGTTHFSCLLPPCCQPLLLATVPLSSQGDNLKSTSSTTLSSWIFSVRLPRQLQLQLPNYFPSILTR